MGDGLGSVHRTGDDLALEDFRAAVETSPNGVVICDSSGAICYANPAAELLLGSEGSELLGAKIESYGLDLDDLEKNRRIVQRGVPPRLLISAVSRTAWRGLEAKQITLIDATEVELETRGLAKSEEKYRDLFENARDMNYVHDLDGNFLDVNRAFEELTGYPRDQLLGQHYSVVVPESALQTSREMHLRKTSGLAEVTNYESIIRSSSGELVPVELNTRIIRENGVPKAIHGSARDLRERKRLEHQLVSAQKMEALALLAGGVAHDFNNLLTVIVWTVHDLQESNELTSPSCKKSLDNILSLSQRSADLTRQLLTYCRERAIRRERFGVNDLILRSTQLLRRLIGRDIEMTFQADSSFDILDGDPTQISQVITNLVINARDALLEGGRIAVSTWNEEGAVGGNTGRQQGIVIQVEDTGCGIDTETLDRIFDPFFTTKIKQGTGLGLAAVQGIVSSHGGTIKVESEVGKGTTFTVWLPTAKLDSANQPGPRDERPNELAVPEEIHTILLVEDEEWLRLLMKRTLERNRYRIVEAAGMVEARKCFQAHREKIRVLLTDLVLPGGSGLRLYDELRSAKPELKVLFTTGHAERATINEIVEVRDLPLLLKPFEPEELLSSVAGIVSRAGVSRPGK